MVARPTSVLLILMRKARTFAFHFLLVLLIQLIVNLDVSCHLFAQQINTDSLQIILSAQPKNEQLRTFRMLANAFREANPKRAIGVAVRALQVARELDARADIIHFELLLGSLYTQTKADTLARRHLEQGLDHAIAQENDSLIARGSLELARYYLSVENPRSAITFLNRAMELTDERKEPGLAARVHTAMADAYKSLGIYQQATDYYLKALRLTEARHDELATAALFNSIGTVYMRTGDYTHALDYFDRALRICEAHHDTGGVVGSLLNKGVIYQKQNKYQEAIDIYFQLLPKTRELKNVEKEAVVTGNIGSTMASQGKLKEGLVYLEQALALKKASGNFKRTLHTLNDIANVKLQLNDATGAKAAAEEVIRLAPQYEGWDQLRYGYLNISKSYAQLSDYRHAHHYLEKHNALNDSLFGIQKAQQINALQIQYDTEKKDTAIRSLQQEKQIANAQRNNYILGAAVLLLLVGGLYVNQRMKTKRNLQLLEKEREVDRMKSDFFANISHEFRTPLSLILGPLDTMLAKVQDNHQRFQLELMKKSASRLLRLINQILDLSRLQFAKPELKAMEVNGVELIRGVTATFQSMADARGIALEFETEQDEITLHCDQEQVETVCINLISNAFKFTDTGGKVTVRILRLPADAKHPDGMLALQVADNGIGIPQEHVRHIFDRFYRAGSASEKQYGGTGIGLALTKELVELHRGSISVESELGKGTTVTIQLPLGRAHLREDQIVSRQMQSDFQTPSVETVLSLQSHPEDPDEAEADRNEKPLILLMDDNEDVRSYIKSIVEDKYILLEAPNGEEGVRMARAFIPDLIISDVMMPVMDGYEACKRLKKDEKTSHIPLILLTAKSSVNSRIEGLETEADLYLSKPFVPQELLLCMHNLIHSRRKLRERYNRQVVLKPVDISINSTDELFLQRLMKILEANYGDETFSVEQLSAEIGMSRSQLHRKLQALTNESTSQFIRTFRLQRAMELLKKNHASISEIAFKVGFSSPPYFNRCFLQHYGCTPSAVIEKSTSAAN